MSSNPDRALSPLESNSDEQLLLFYTSNAQSGARAFETLFDKHFNRLHAWLVVRGAPPSIAEDLAQEAFVRIVKAAKTFNEDRGSFRTWLFKVAKNLYIDYLRENGNRQMIPLEDCELVARAIPEDVLQLDKYLHEMKPELREPLELFAIGGMTAQEISKVLDLAEGTVYSRLHRARRELREKMDPGANIKRIPPRALSPPKAARPQVRETQLSISFEEEHSSE